MPAANTARFHFFMAGILASLVIVAAVLAHLVHLSGFGHVAHSLPWFLLLAGVGCYCRLRGFARLMEALFLTIWAVLLNNTLGVLIQIAGRTPTPLVETALARMDGRIGLNTGSVVRWISHFPRLQTVFTIAYGLVPLLIFAALMVPTLWGRAERARRYVLAVTIALLITAALFAIWPANGPWTVYGFAPSKDQAKFISDLLLLKSAQPARIDLISSAIVTFPSFHTVLAILSVVALWESGRARWFVFAIGTAICISTLTTGWHFFIDVIGGICVAWIAQGCSAWAIRALTVSATPSVSQVSLPRELAA